MFQNPLFFCIRLDPMGYVRHDSKIEYVRHDSKIEGLFSTVTAHSLHPPRLFAGGGGWLQISGGIHVLLM